MVRRGPRVTNRQCPRCGSTDVKGGESVFYNHRRRKTEMRVVCKCGRCEWEGPWEMLQKQKLVKSERHDMKRKSLSNKKGDKNTTE